MTSEGNPSTVFSRTPSHLALFCLKHEKGKSFVNEFKFTNGPSFGTDGKVGMEMSKLNLIFITVCLLASSILPIWATDTWMPHSSYLTRSVSDAHDFARLLREDRVVAQRFANHYGMNNDAIADYVEQHGKVVTITKPTRVTEYYIDKSGRTHRHQKLLRPGRKMLVVGNTPVLDLRCGNPIGKVLPPVPAPPRPVARALPAPPAELPTPEVEVTEVPAIPPIEEAPPPPPVAVVPPAPTPPPAPAPTPVVSRGRPFPWFLLAALFEFHHGDEEEAPPPPPPPPVIPEASSIALGVGGMGFVLTYLRMRRSR